MSADPWLLVIDMQRVFGDLDSYWTTPRFGQILPRVQQLITEHAPRVVFTRFVAPAEPVGAWRDYYADWPRALTGEDDPQYALVDELTGLPALAGIELPVISRTTFGKWDAELAGLIGTEAEVIMVGVSTDCCVLSTALAAADAGVSVRVESAACAGASDDDHDRALAAMALYTPLITVR